MCVLLRTMRPVLDPDEGSDGHSARSQNVHMALARQELVARAKEDYMQQIEQD